MYREGHISSIRFIGTFTDIDVSPSTDLDILVRVGKSSVFFQSMLSVSSDFTVKIFEGPTVTSPGTPIPLYSLDRTSTASTPTTVFRDPQLSATGTELGSTLVRSDGEQERGIGEIVLKPNTDYILQLCNIGTGQSSMSVKISLLDGSAE